MSFRFNIKLSFHFPVKAYYYNCTSGTEGVTFSDHPDCSVAYSSWCLSKTLVCSQQIIRVTTSVRQCIATWVAGDILAIFVPEDSYMWVRSATWEINSTFEVILLLDSVITTELFPVVSTTTPKFNNWFICGTTSNNIYSELTTTQVVQIIVHSLPSSRGSNHYVPYTPTCNSDQEVWPSK